MKPLLVLLACVGAVRLMLPFEQSQTFEPRQAACLRLVVVIVKTSASSSALQHIAIA